MPIRVKSGVIVVRLAVWALAGGATLLPIVAIPTALTVHVVDDTVTLSWTAAFLDQTTYVIEAGSAPGLADLANFSTGDIRTTFRATHVPNVVYFVRVRAANAAGVSAPSNEVTAIVSFGGCVPRAPAGLIASVRANTITLRWTAEVDTPSFQLEAGSAPGLTNLFLRDVGNTRTLMGNAPPGDRAR